MRRTSGSWPLRSFQEIRTTGSPRSLLGVCDQAQVAGVRANWQILEITRRHWQIPVRSHVSGVMVNRINLVTNFSWFGRLPLYLLPEFVEREGGNFHPKKGK